MENFLKIRHDAGFALFKTQKLTMHQTHAPTSIDSFHILLVTGVLCLLVHVYRTSCQHIYTSVIVSDNLNGCSTRLVLETAALCDIFVRSAVYKSSYLLT